METASVPSSLDPSSATSSPSFVSRLQSLLSLHYPHYGQVCYEPIVLEGGQYRGRLLLFGMTIDSQDLYPSWEEAKEAVARLGLDLLNELFRILLHRPENDDRLQMLFRPLQEALSASVSPLANNPEEEEKAMVKLGLPPVVREEAIRQEAERAIQPAPFNPLLNAILRKLGDSNKIGQGNGTDITALKPAPQELSTVQDYHGFAQKPSPSMPGLAQGEHSVLKNEPKLSLQQGETEEFNPVVALHQHWQRRMTSCDQPSYDYFSKQGYYGCICHYDGHALRAEAHYRTKNSAKLEASRLLCILILGEAFVTMPPVPRDDLADAAAKLSKKNPPTLALANPAPQEKAGHEANPGPNRSLEASRDAVEANPRSGPNAPTVAPLHGTMAVEGSEIQPAAAPVNLSLPQGRKFVSLINEYCQVAKLPQPEYQFSSGKSLSAFFVCYCDAFFDGDGERPREVGDRFVSAAFAKKNDAKEDCAARLFLHLERQGYVDREGRVLRHNLKGLVNRKRAVELALQERAQAVRPKNFSPVPGMGGMPPPPPFLPLPPMAAGMPPPDPHFIAMLIQQQQQQQQQYWSQQQQSYTNVHNTHASIHDAHNVHPTRASHLAGSSLNSSSSATDAATGRRPPFDPRPRPQ